MGDIAFLDFKNEGSTKLLLEEKWKQVKCGSSPFNVASMKSGSPIKTSTAIKNGSYANQACGGSVATADAAVTGLPVTCMPFTLKLVVPPTPTLGWSCDFDQQNVMEGGTRGTVAPITQVTASHQTRE